MLEFLRNSTLASYSDFWAAWCLGTLVATIPMGLALLATARARHTSASARHFIYVAVLCGAACLPLAAHMLPRLELSVLPARPQVAHPRVAQQLAKATTIDARLLAQTSAATLSNERAQEDRMQSALALLWLLGVCAFALRRLSAQRALRTLEEASRVIESRVWHSVLNDLLAELGMTSKVRLITHPEARTPATWGLRDTVILLPESAQQWSKDRRRAMLLHELGHVRRGDVRTQLCVDLACALLWFHPLAWQLHKRIECERENACDDVVLCCGARPSRYAQVLYDMYEHFSRNAPGLRSQAAFALLEGRSAPSTMERRLSCLLDPERARASGSLAQRCLFVSLSIALVLPLASAKLVRARVAAQQVANPLIASLQAADKTVALEILDSAGDQAEQTVADALPTTVPPPAMISADMFSAAMTPAAAIPPPVIQSVAKPQGNENPKKKQPARPMIALKGFAIATFTRTGSAGGSTTSASSTSSASSSSSSSGKFSVSAFTFSRHTSAQVSELLPTLLRAGSARIVDRIPSPRASDRGVGDR